MPSNSKFTRDDNGNIAVRVVSNTGVSEQPDSMFTTDADGNVAVRVVGIGGGGGGAVSSVNGKTGAVVLDAEDVGALPSDTHIPVDPVQADWDEADQEALDYIKNKPTIPTPTQYDTMPTASVGNVGKIVQFTGNQPTVPASATISQTTGSGLTDLDVDVATFESAEQPSGNETVNFVASIESDSLSPTSFAYGDTTITIDQATFLTAAKSNVYTGDWASVALVQIDLVDSTQGCVWVYDSADNMLGYLYVTYAALGESYGVDFGENFQFNEQGTLNMYYTPAGVQWAKGGNIVTIADYGISFTGNPTDGDVLTVDYTAGIRGYENGYFYQNQPKYGDPSATISQTTGSGLTDLTVDAVKFSKQESETGEYDFVKVTTPSSYNLESGQPEFSVVMDADSVKERLENGGHDASQFYLGYSGGSYQIGYDADTLYYSGITASGLYSIFSITVPENPDASADGTWGIFVYADSFDGWKLNNNEVNISDYGITYTGTPVNNDVLTVAYTAPAVIGYSWNQKDVQPAGNGGSQEIEYDTEIIFDPQTDTNTPLGWVAEFENLPTGDYYFYVKTAKYAADANYQNVLVWQTNKFSFHWDSTWNGAANYSDFGHSVLGAPVLDGEFVGDSTQTTLFNTGDSLLWVYYNDSGNKYAVSPYNYALIETCANNLYTGGNGGIVYKISKLYGGAEPQTITTGKKYVYDYSLSGYSYYNGAGNRTAILPQYPTIYPQGNNFALLVSDASSTNKTIEIPVSMSPTDTATCGFRIIMRCDEGELDAYVWYKYYGNTTQQIKNATGVFANSRFYKKTNSGSIFLSLDNSAFALLPNQSEYIYGFVGIFGTLCDRNAYANVVTEDVSGSDFSMLNFEKSGLAVVMETPTAGNYGGVVQYVGETDANYTNGYFYKADGTLVNIPESLTASDISPNDFSITVDISSVIGLCINQFGWDKQTAIWYLNTYQNWTVDYDADNGVINSVQWNNVGSWSDADWLACFTVSTTSSYSGTFSVSFVGVYAEGHQELQNPHWTRTDVQPDVATALQSVTGYDATKTQTLKNISGTLTWVDD